MHRVVNWNIIYQNNLVKFLNDALFNLCKVKFTNHISAYLYFEFNKSYTQSEQKIMCSDTLTPA
jgi:hypothetical protein